jgi:predicted nucleotidyltransferase
MKRDDVLRRLKERENDLRDKGVLHAALFGSFVRDEQRTGSDIDILVELDAAKVVTIYDYAGVKRYIAGLFDAPVDVVSRETLKAHVRPTATAEAIYAF